MPRRSSRDLKRRHSRADLDDAVPFFGDSDVSDVVDSQRIDSTEEPDGDSNSNAASTSGSTSGAACSSGSSSPVVLSSFKRVRHLPHARMRNLMPVVSACTSSAPSTPERPNELDLTDVDDSSNANILHNSISTSSSFSSLAAIATVASSLGQIDSLVNLEHQLQCKIVSNVLLPAREPGIQWRREYPLRSRIRESRAAAAALELQLRPKSFDHLAPELYLKILSYLSVVDVVRCQRVSRHFQLSVVKHLRLTKRINFCSGLPFTFLSASLSDTVLARLLATCPEVTHILGFYPRRILSQSELDSSTMFGNANLSGAYLTYNGILVALRQCKKLKSIELMDIELMSRCCVTFPKVKFHGMFRNRPDLWDCSDAYPSHGLPIPDSSQRITLHPHIFNLSKVDLQSVCLNYLPRMECVRYLYLKWIRFTGSDPFVHFYAPKLQSFIMNNCAGPSNPLKYLRIFTALARAPALSRLEMVGVRFVGGLLEHIVEEMQGEVRAFRQLQKMVFTSNRSMGEVDIGYLLLTAADQLNHTALQASLCRDSLFVALAQAQASFPRLEILFLGYQDPFPEAGKWSREQLSELGLLEQAEVGACLLTDKGLWYAAQAFRRLQSLTVRNAPFLRHPELWCDTFAHLKSLTLEKCTCLMLESLERLINNASLCPCLEMLVLRDLFPAPPRSCAFLGIPAGQKWGIFPQNGASSSSSGGGEASAALQAAHRQLPGIRIPVMHGLGLLAPPRRLVMFRGQLQQHQREGCSQVVVPPLLFVQHDQHRHEFYSRGAQTTVGKVAAVNIATDEHQSLQSSTTTESSDISEAQAEPLLRHEARVWLARDVACDTHDLRLHEVVDHNNSVTGILHVRSSSLSTLHVERCGLREVHLTAEATRLRHFTAEGCPVLRAVHFADSRALRRLRLVACPALRLRHLMHQLRNLYECAPHHEEHLFVQLRPVGRSYDCSLEQHLLGMKHAHLALSHDFGRDVTEEQLDRLHSDLHQHFRDVMTFAENLLRRDYMRETCEIRETVAQNSFSDGKNLKYMTGHLESRRWDLLTDIPWVHECGVSFFSSSSYTSSSSSGEDADQLYQNFIETHLAAGCYKAVRYGLHLHVQCIDMDYSNSSPLFYDNDYVDDEDEDD